MDAAHNTFYTSQLNQPQHAEDKSKQSPYKVALIALGIILMIGGAVAAGVLFSYLGNASLICVLAIPIGIALVIAGVRCNLAGRQVNNNTVVTIGSAEACLDENGIREELKKISGKQNVDVLVIYGNGKVALNEDPGFVALNPKKVILVGGRIVHESCTGYRLDDRLANNKEWLSSIVRMTSEGGQRRQERYIPNTFVQQLIVNSVDEAIAHKPPSRGIFKGNYHQVYCVMEKKNDDPVRPIPPEYLKQPAGEVPEWAVDYIKKESGKHWDISVVPKHENLAPGQFRPCGVYICNDYIKEAVFGIVANNAGKIEYRFFVNRQDARNAIEALICQLL